MKTILVVLCVAVFAEASQYHHYRHLLEEANEESITIDLGPLKTEAKYGVELEPACHHDSSEEVPSDYVPSHNARHFFRILRPMFPVGLVTIPPLDPYKSHEITQAVHRHQYMQGYTNLTNIELTGAKQFKLSKVSVKLQSHELEVDTHHKLLKANADFETHLSGKINLHIHGQASVSYEGLTVETKIHTMTDPEGKHLQIQDMKETITADNLRVTLSNVFVDGKPFDLKKSEPLVKRSLQEVTHDIAQAQNAAYAQIINHAFTGVTREQVLAFLLDYESHK